MNFERRPVRLILPTRCEAVTASIGSCLLVGGRCVLSDTSGADAILIDAFDDQHVIRALDLTDQQFDATFVEMTLDRVAALQAGISRLRRPANIVVIGSHAWLGQWDSTAQAAASAAMVGIVRSVAIEYASEGLRVNLLALPLGTRPADQVMIADAADQALALLTTRSISGETVLLDNGNNLKFRQAMRR